MLRAEADGKPVPDVDRADRHRDLRHFFFGKMRLQRLVVGIRRACFGDIGLVVDVCWYVVGATLGMVPILCGDVVDAKASSTSGLLSGRVRQVIAKPHGTLAGWSFVSRDIRSSCGFVNERSSFWRMVVTFGWLRSRWHRSG
jgi:hypothetical protein